MSVSLNMNQLLDLNRACVTHGSATAAALRQPSLPRQALLLLHCLASVVGHGKHVGASRSSTKPVPRRMTSLNVQSGYIWFNNPFNSPPTIWIAKPLHARARSEPAQRHPQVGQFETPLRMIFGHNSSKNMRKGENTHKVKWGGLLIKILIKIVHYPSPTDFTIFLL